MFVAYTSSQTYECVSIVVKVTHTSCGVGNLACGAIHVIYFIYGGGHSAGFHTYLIHKLDISCTWYLILRSSCALVLGAKLIYVWWFSRIWMPGPIKTIGVNSFGYVPPTFFFVYTIHHWRWVIIGISITFLGHKVYASIFLPLTGPSMTLMILPGHWFPKKIKARIVR